MKKNRPNYITWTLCTSLITAIPLFSGEKQLEEEPRISIGTNQLTTAEEEQNRKRRFADEEQNFLHKETIPLEEQPLEFVEEQKQRTEASPDEDRILNDVVYYNSHTDALHQLFNVSYDGGALELGDGSVWEVSWGDRYKTRDWNTQQTLLVAPNYSWFSNYKFKFINTETGETAKVNMTLGPLTSSLATHWIQHIDYYSGVIWLEDGSSWNMSWFDSNIVANFNVGDYVFIGTNDGWWRSMNPNILINLTDFEYARGKRIN